MPKILYIVSSWPDERGFGGQLRSLHVGRALKHMGDVTLLYVGSEARNREAMAVAAREFELLPPVEPLLAPNVGWRAKLKWAFDTTYLNLHGFVASPEDRERLNQLLPGFDLVWVLNSRTPNILQRWSWPHSHLDIDDVPSTYLRAVAQNGSRLSQRIKARIGQHLLARRESRLLQRFSSLSVCSSADRQYLGSSPKIHIVPNGFQRPSSLPVRAVVEDAPRIGFIGLFSYAPNLDGIRWFVSHCWPEIRRRVPGIKLRLVGKGTDGPDKPGADDIDGLGWVADPAEEIATWSAMIVPIRFGGGTRIKLAEGFSRKVPTVSTTLGAFGYEVTNRNQLLLADSAADFAHACVELLRDQNFAAEMVERAWQDFLAKWTWDSIYPQVESAARSCLQQSQPASVPHK